MKLGPFVKCPHPEMIEAIGIAGFDFAVVDMEHTPLGPRDLYPLILAAECHQLELIVRIPENSERYIKWCLDLGIAYVQVPNILTADDAQAAARAGRFRDGERGLCRFVRAARFSAMPRVDYINYSDATGRLVLQIEHVSALSNIASIINSMDRGLATIFFGPYDLSASMGKPGAVRDPEVTGAIEAAIRQCKAAGFDVGTFASDAQEGRFWAEREVDMIEYGSDLALFMDGAAGLLNARDSWKHRA